MKFNTPTTISFDDNLRISSSVITLGNFDGVHLGHKNLIDNLITESKKKDDTVSLLITFNPHTQNILSHNNNLELITLHKDKIELLNEYGIDYISIIDFDNNFSKLSAEEFIELIIHKYNPESIIIGYDSKFGYKGKGDYLFLKEYLSQRNINIYQNKPYSLNAKIIKSSLIKNLIINGDIKTVNKYLGRRFAISGRIIKGDKIGHSLGFPTANLSLEDTQQIIPKVGVYSVNLFFDNVEYKALCNIGHRPTFFENGKLSIESYIIDYDKLNLYDEKVDIKFNFYIREEKTFENKEDLIKQINKDIQVIE